MWWSTFWPSLNQSRSYMKQAIVEIADNAKCNLNNKECVFCGWRSQLWKEKDIENKFLGNIKIHLSSAFLFSRELLDCPFFYFWQSAMRDVLQIQHGVIRTQLMGTGQIVNVVSQSYLLDLINILDENTQGNPDSDSGFSKRLKHIHNA